MVVRNVELLRLDLGGSLLTLLALLSSSTQSGQRVLLLLLGHPGMGSHVGTLADCRAADAVAASVAGLGCCCHPGVAVRRQVLIKLVDIKAPHVGDDLAAQLANVYSAKVDVLVRKWGCTDRQSHPSYQHFAQARGFQMHHSVWTLDMDYCLFSALNTSPFVDRKRRR